MAGYWNIFPIYGHINDRLGITLIDPSADPPIPTVTTGSPWNPNFLLIVSAVWSLMVPIAFPLTENNGFLGTNIPLELGLALTAEAVLAISAIVYEVFKRKNQNKPKSSASAID
jgi:hypothetical protein